MNSARSKIPPFSFPVAFKSPWKILLITALLTIAISAAVLFLATGQEESVADRPLLVPPPPEIDPGAVKQLLERDSIQAIDDPMFETAAEAAASMQPDERVIGVVINGDARAYPINILSVHEIVNDVVGGEAVAVTWCPLCYTALVFSRQVEGRDESLTFGVSGSLLYETLVFYDHQTGSLWSQLYGAAIEGSLADTRLSFFSSVNTEWSSWQAEHPESRVLSKDLTCAQFNCGTYSSNPLHSYHVDPYQSYYVQPGEGVINRGLIREEFERAPKKRLLGLRIGGGERAYPYSILRERPLINDKVRGTPVLVWFEAETETGLAFLRQIDDRILTFELDPDEPGHLLDQESGSRWQAKAGTAIDGPLKGARLPHVIATTAFEFGWYSYFPDSETFEAG